jgi:hypothetical protein
MTESYLKKFNVTLRDFVADLKNVFRENDSTLMHLETVAEITKVNARIVITYFQEIVLKPLFLEKIVNEDINFFLHYDYQEYITNSYGSILMSKLKNIVKELQSQSDNEAISTIFNWFKLLVFYSMSDLGMNAKEEMLKYKRDA